MKTLKQNNYKWLLDAGHFGWENRKRHRINSQEIMTRLAGMMERGADRLFADFQSRQSDAFEK